MAGLFVVLFVGQSFFHLARRIKRCRENLWLIGDARVCVFNGEGVNLGGKTSVQIVITGDV